MSNAGSYTCNIHLSLNSLLAVAGLGGGGAEKKGQLLKTPSVGLTSVHHITHALDICIVTPAAH